MKCWVFERNEEGERKNARRSQSYVECFFAKPDEVAAEKLALQPSPNCQHALAFGLKCTQAMIQHVLIVTAQANSSKSLPIH